MHVRRGFLIVVSAVGLLAAACGSGSSPAKSAAPTTTAAERVATSPATSTTVKVADASAEGVRTGLPQGTVHLSYKVGPIIVKPGQNSIKYSGGKIPQPDVDGWILTLKPNIRRADGSVPPVDVIHLHHGVWLNLSAKDPTSPGLPERFFAAGEEKTTAEMPDGYGYRFKTGDRWLLNYMVHNLTPTQDTIWLTYDIDFLPATAPAAQTITAAHPIWMDVRNGEIYPVFDVHKGTGKDGLYTYPDDATDPYAGGPPKNEWTVPTDMVLVGTGGHLHPGGLHTDLYVDRAGATAHLFESSARYYEPAGAVSWDVAMTVTNDDYRVALKQGDVLRTTATYDSKRASWYESMGIMVSWVADAPAPGEAPAPDPFTTKVDAPGHLTHGHLAENDNHGGTKVTLTDLTKVPQAAGKPTIPITGFRYNEGDMSQEGPIPTVKQGQSLRYLNLDPTGEDGIWHTITACKAPCNEDTGIAYPLADGDIDFDSGQLGTAGVPTANRNDWDTPVDLPVGVYTYFCRVHPFMRGAFSVTAG